MRFETINLLMLMWFVPVILFLYWLGAVKRGRGMTLFHFQGVRRARYLLRHWLRAAFFLLGFVFAVLALAGPAWNVKNRIIQRSGRDVVFLVDVSRSMLAEDIAPNRLERAKLAIYDALEVISEDRVALVAFAGSSVIKCPLTWDYGFFKTAVKSLSVESVSRGGTLPGDALRKIMEEVFDGQDGSYKDVILISDGGDQESFPQKAAETAGNTGVRLLVIGLGDEETGARIPLPEDNGGRQFLTYQGQEVWTRLDSESLRAMALSTPEGQYLNAGTGNFNLAEIYSSFIGRAKGGSRAEEVVQEYENMYQLFLLLAVLCLIISMGIPRLDRRHSA